MRKTLREHYREKRQRYGVDYPREYDADLRRLVFSTRQSLRQLPPAPPASSAAPARQLRRKVAALTGEHLSTRSTRSSTT